MRKAKLIINPSTGKKRGRIAPIHKLTLEDISQLYVPIESTEKIIRMVKKACSSAKIKLEIEFTKKRDHATEIAKKAAKQRYDIVIAAGGDGTINEVINGIAGTKTALGIIPLGTANVLALELGIPFNIKKAIEIITHGKAQKIDLGFASTTQGSRYFAMQAGIGFDAKVIQGIDSLTKKVLGSLAYPLVALIKLLTYRWHKIYIEHSRRSMGYFVIVSNIRYYGGEFQVADKASMMDGYLDLVILRHKNWWRLLRYLSSFSVKKLRKHMHIEYFHTKKAKIYSRHKQLVHVDAEIIGTTPVEVKVVPKALNVMVG